MEKVLSLKFTAGGKSESSPPPFFFFCFADECGC